MDRVDRTSWEGLDPKVFVERCYINSTSLSCTVQSLMPLSVVVLATKLVILEYKQADKDGWFCRTDYNSMVLKRTICV